MKAQTDSLLAAQAREEAEQAKARAEAQAVAGRGEQPAEVESLVIVRSRDDD